MDLKIQLNSRDLEKEGGIPTLFLEGLCTENENIKRNNFRISNVQSKKM